MEIETKTKELFDLIDKSRNKFSEYIRSSYGDTINDRLDYALKITSEHLDKYQLYSLSLLSDLSIDWAVVKVLNEEEFQIIDKFSRSSFDDMNNSNLNNIVQYSKTIIQLSKNLNEIYLTQNISGTLFYKRCFNDIKKNNQEIKSIKNSVSNAKNEIDDLVKDANLLNERHALKGFNKHYAKLDRYHSFNALLLFLTVILGYSLILCSVVICFLLNTNQLEFFYFNKNNWQIIIANEITFNFILLALTLWISKLHSATRAVALSYQHKSALCDALLSFIASIKDEKDSTSKDINNDIRNTILLESSRIIFTQPEVRLVGKSDSIDKKLLETIRDIVLVTRKD